MVIYVHRQTLAEAEEPGTIRFHFGAYGFCELLVSESGGDP